MSDSLETCADCGLLTMERTSYVVRVPESRRQKYVENPAFDGVRFRLCVKCWDKMVGLAAMGMLR